MSNQEPRSVLRITLMNIHVLYFHKKTIQDLSEMLEQGTDVAVPTFAAQMRPKLDFPTII